VISPTNWWSSAAIEESRSDGGTHGADSIHRGAAQTLPTRGKLPAACVDQSNGAISPRRSALNGGSNIQCRRSTRQWRCGGDRDNPPGEPLLALPQRPLGLPNRPDIRRPSFGGGVHLAENPQRNITGAASPGLLRAHDTTMWSPRFPASPSRSSAEGSACVLLSTLDEVGLGRVMAIRPLLRRNRFQKALRCARKTGHCGGARDRPDDPWSPRRTWSGFAVAPLPGFAFFAVARRRWVARHAADAESTGLEAPLIPPGLSFAQASGRA